MAGDDLVELKFRLYDGTDIGPNKYAPASTVATLKESILSQWPQGDYPGLAMLLCFWFQGFVIEVASFIPSFAWLCSAAPCHKVTIQKIFGIFCHGQNNLLGLHTFGPLGGNPQVAKSRVYALHADLSYIPPCCTSYFSCRVTIYVLDLGFYDI
jgi:hypothetical protein